MNLLDNIYAAPSPIHGQGGFARRPIPAGARVVEYVGQKISKAESSCGARRKTGAS